MANVRACSKVKVWVEAGAPWLMTGGSTDQATLIESRSAKPRMGTVSEVQRKPSHALGAAWPQAVYGHEVADHSHSTERRR